MSIDEDIRLKALLFLKPQIEIVENCVKDRVIKKIEMVQLGLEFTFSENMGKYQWHFVSWA